MTGLQNTYTMCDWETARRMTGWDLKKKNLHGGVFLYTVVRGKIASLLFMVLYPAYEASRTEEGDKVHVSY